MRANELQSRKASLAGDQRGAIMVIGLFVALSLIGSLWMMIGIGQAVVFRDRGQEAADAIALSVAAVDARGMDMIAVLNLISLALVGVYLLIQIVADAMMLTVFHFFTGLGIDGKNTDYMQNGVLTVTLPILGGTSAAVALITPWIGTLITAPEVASHYPGFEKTGSFPAFGLQNIPGAGFSTAMQIPKNASRGRRDERDRPGKLEKEREKWAKEAEKARKDGKKPSEPPKWPTPDEIKASENLKDTNAIIGTIRLGLPVAFEDNQTLCIRGMMAVPDMIADLLNLPDSVKDLISTVVGGAVNIYADFRCGNKPFPWLGPKKMVGGNGSIAMQVYGFSEGTFGDRSESKVRLAGYLFNDGVPSNRHRYNAQAEFFYNCKEVFLDDNCNGQSITGGGTGRESALYWPGWKARLVKYKSPKQSLFENLVNGTHRAAIDTAFDGIEIGLRGVFGRSAGGDKMAGIVAKFGKRLFERSDYAKDAIEARDAIKEKGKEIFNDADNYH